MFRMDPGITAGPVTFNGFGGAIYWNFPAPNLTLDIADVMAMADGGAPMPPKDESVMPVFGDRSLAFRTSLSLVNPKTVIVEPEIAVRWLAGDGIQQITLNGGFYILAMDYESRDETARLWGNTSTGITFERGLDGKKKVAVVGTNSIYANIIPDVLFGAGPEKLLVSSAFAIGSEELFQGYDIDHSDRDSTYWFLNVGNPYEGNMGGIKFELPGFNMDKADNDGAGLTKDGSGVADVGGSGGLSVQFYMMTGQAVPLDLPEPPGKIEDLFNIINSHQDGNSFDGGSKQDARENSDVTQTGAGIVMGAHVMASAEINALLTAKFALLSGMDVMLVRSRDPISCITTGGRYVEEVGVNQWYGRGRAYLGMEGTLGIEGEILGKEVSVNLMHLVAAVMVEAGGPRPMYLDGRAGVYYNILDGFIEGSARIKIAVGDPCRPPEGQPFGFPVIVETSPHEEIGDELVNAFVEPAASFAIRLAEDPDNPIPAEYMQVEDVTGEMVRRLGYIHEFSITPVGGGERADYSRDPDWPLLVSDGYAASYHPRSSISGLWGEEAPTRWRYRLVVRGKEQMADGSWADIPGPQGERHWEEVREFTFTTDALPDAFSHSQVGITKPLRYQHYYLQDEFGGRSARVKLYNDYSDTYFAPEDENGWDYTYHALLVDANTAEELGRVNANYNGPSKQVTFQLPAGLPNATEITTFLVKKLNPPAGAIMMNRENILVASGGTDYGAEADISEEYEVNAETVNLEDQINLGAGETKIYEWTFRTSQHNTLSQKLAGLELRASPQPGYQTIRFEGDYEGFDRYEIKGKPYRFGTSTPEQVPGYTAEPLIELADPFNSSFHNTKSKPLLGGFAELYDEEYADQPQGIRQAMNTGNLPGQNGQGSWHIFRWAPYLYNTNYNWVSSEYLHENLNEEMTAMHLTRNDHFSFTTDARGSSPYLTATYYITDKVLEDAAYIVDWYEQQRDRIMDPDAFGASINGLVSVSSPDQREVRLANLDAAYYEILSSSLIQDDDVSLLSGSLNQQYGNSFNPWTANLFSGAVAAAPAGGGGGGLTGTFTVTATATGTINFGGLSSASSGGSSIGSNNVTLLQNDVGIADFDLPQLYGFSNRLRFKYRQLFTSGSIGGTVYKALDN